MRYTKKPITIEAIQYTSLNSSEIFGFVGQTLKMELESDSAYLAGQGTPIYSISIPTLEGDMKAMPGDWIIKGVNGEFYPCKPDIFEKTYSEGSPTPPQICGVALIEQERHEQLTKHGFSVERDVDFYKNEELINGAYAYIAIDSSYWPWDTNAFKPTGDRIKDLTKAGAMLAAHIDLLLHLQQSK